MLPEWGQPLDAIVQFAYVVDDVDEAAMRYVGRLGVGPWYVRGPFAPPHARHRGRPTKPTFSVGRAFSGHAMLELIVQHDDGPSVFHEAPGPRRYGFHHWGRVTRSFDVDVAAFATAGYEEAFADVLPTGSRVVYMDATRELPGMIELVEHTDAQEQVYAAIYRASVGWDGSDPLRREG